MRAAVFALAVALAAPATVEDLGTLPGGSAATVFAIDGRYLAGTSTQEGGQHAFVSDGGPLRDLGTLPGLTQSTANDVNASGVVVGAAYSATGTEARAVRWANGPAEDLGHLGGGEAVALGVDGAGSVVGWSATAGGAIHAFRWREGRMVDLDGLLPKPAGSTVESATRINDDGVVAGRLVLGSGERLGYVSDGTTFDVVRTAPGAPVEIRDLAPDGTVVGTAGTDAFTWKDGVARDLPPLPGDGCATAVAVTSSLDVVGTSSACGRSRTRAVLWRDGVPADLHALTAPAEGIVLGGGFAADDATGIGGFAETVAGSHAALLRLTGDTGRLAGPDAIGTAVAVSRAFAPQLGGPGGAVVAAVDAPADLATGALLAARLGRPLLLTGRTALDPQVREILALRVGGTATVHLVGGTAVLADDVEADVAALGLRPERVAGLDRYGTNEAAARVVGGPTGFAVDGSDATTALSAVPLAAHVRRWIAMTRPGQSAPDGARALTAVDRDGVAAELAPRPLAPVLTRLGRIADGAVAAVLASRAGSPLRWSAAGERPPGIGFLVGGTAVLP